MASMIKNAAIAISAALSALVSFASLEDPSQRTTGPFPPTPYGAYDLTLQRGLAKLRFFAFKDPSGGSFDSAWLVQAPSTCGDAAVAELRPTPVPFLAPSWNPHEGRLVYRGSNGRFANAGFAQFEGRDAVRGHFITTNDGLAEANRDGVLSPIPFTGLRAREERRVLEAAAGTGERAPLANGETAGIYVGTLSNGTGARLTLNYSRLEGVGRWDATFRVGRHDGFAMTGAQDEPNLIRVTRYPVPSSAWLSGLVATVVRDASGAPLLTGAFYVARTGCVHALSMRRVAESRTDAFR